MQPLNKSELLERLQKVWRVEQRGRVFKWMQQPLKRLQAVGIKRFYYPVIRKGILVKAQTCWGESMYVLLPAAAEVFLTGTKVHPSEIRLSQWLVQHVKPGQTFVDGGAHYGYFSLLFRYLSGNDSKVWSFEPSVETFQILQRNKRDGIELINKALSDHTGTVVMTQSDVLHSEANAVTQDGDASGVTIECIKLDDYLPDKSRVDYIKLDVEGHEYEALQGAAQIIEAQHPIIILEIWNPAHRDNLNQLRAVEWLIQKGYNLFLPAEYGTDIPCAAVDDIYTEAWDSFNIILKPNT